MIQLGLSVPERSEVIQNYLIAHKDVNKVYLFYYKEPPNYEIDSSLVENLDEVKLTEYADIQMYKVFYPLMESIDENSLLIFDGCMRTQKRPDLNYSCIKNYSGQTSHKIIFEYFPFIEDVNDFMILADFQYPGRYKGRSFDPEILGDMDVFASPIELELRSVKVGLTPDAEERYTAYKDRLVAEIENKHPITMLWQLHLYAGNLKRPAIYSNRAYMARNNRLKLDNVFTYPAAEVNHGYTIIDFPQKRLWFNDFLQKTGMKTIEFLNTELPVDKHYYEELTKWVGRLSYFYAQASIYQRKRAGSVTTQD